jgi:DNA-binding protein HU-beta
MNKDDIVAIVATRARITKKDAAAAVDAVFDTMLEALASGEGVKVAGFGSFEVKTHIARTGMNPITKEPIQIPAMQAIAFRAGKAAKEKVNNK